MDATNSQAAKKLKRAEITVKTPKSWTVTKRERIATHPHHRGATKNTTDTSVIGSSG